MHKKDDAFLNFKNRIDYIQKLLETDEGIKKVINNYMPVGVPDIWGISEIGELFEQSFIDSVEELLSPNNKSNIVARYLSYRVQKSLNTKADDDFESKLRSFFFKRNT